MGVGHCDGVVLDRGREATVIVQAKHRAVIVLGPLGEQLPDKIVLLADAAKTSVLHSREAVAELRKPDLESGKPAIFSRHRTPP